MLIKFNNSDKLYNLVYHNTGRLITLSNSIDELPEDNTSGFSLIDDFDNETVLQDHSNHTIVYDKTETSVTYVDKYIDYYVVFIVNENDYVVGYIIKRTDELKDNEVSYEVIPELEYTEGYKVQIFDEDGFYLYKVVDDEIVSTTEDEKDAWMSEKESKALKNALSSKINEINTICNTAIVTGVDFNGEHFSYSLEDQNNIKDLVETVKVTGLASPYHADNGGNCKLYSAGDILGIYIAQSTNKTHHTTYANQLKQYVRTLTTAEEIEAVVYGQELTGEYLETYNVIMAQAQVIANAFASVTSI